MTRAQFAAEQAKQIRQIALTIVNRTELGASIDIDWHRVSADFNRISAKAKLAAQQAADESRRALPYPPEVL